MSSAYTNYKKSRAAKTTSGFFRASYLVMRDLIRHNGVKQLVRTLQIDREEQRLAR
jgi:hypothetical protein